MAKNDQLPERVSVRKETKIVNSNTDTKVYIGFPYYTQELPIKHEDLDELIQKLTLIKQSK